MRSVCSSVELVHILRSVSNIVELFHKTRSQIQMNSVASYIL
jgi:hypothetical protein